MVREALVGTGIKPGSTHHQKKKTTLKTPTINIFFNIYIFSLLSRN